MLATCFCFAVHVPLLLVLCCFAVYMNIISLRRLSPDLGTCLATSVLCQITTKVLVQASIVVMWLSMLFVFFDFEFRTNAKNMSFAFCGLFTLILLGTKQIMMKLAIIETLRARGGQEGEQKVKWQCPEPFSLQSWRPVAAIPRVLARGPDGRETG